MPRLTNLGHVFRLTRAGFVLAREGAFVDLDPRRCRRSPAPLFLANLLARGGARGFSGLAAAIDRLGPSYVKLGQFLATRPDIVGAKVAIELEKLQDRMAPADRAIAVAALEAAFGAPIDTLFVEFGEPVAAASIAQVHQARVRDADGERDVAVKLLRPGVERRFARDLADMFFAARSAERFEPRLRRLRLVEVVETLARSVKVEMDFRLEAAAAAEFAENLADDPGFRAPKIDWDRTTRAALTMEWIDGTPLSDPARLAELGFDPPKLGRALDPVVPAPRAARRLLPRRHAPGQFLRRRRGAHRRDRFRHHGPARPQGAAVSRRNPLRLHPPRLPARGGGAFRGRLRAGDPSGRGFRPGDPRRRRADPRPHRRPDLDGQAADAAVRGHGLFDMSTRLELVMLQKTMVVVEGVARKLDPHLDMWATAEPVVGGWIAENLGPRGRLEDVGGALAQMGRLLIDAPERLERLARRLEADDDRRAGRPTEPPRRGIAIPAALWAIAGILLLIVYHFS